MLTDILQLLSAGVLGIFVGAQICEGALFVPYWKSLSAADFFEMHKTFGKKIYRFFAPLTILATVISLVTAFLTVIKADHCIYAILMGVFTLLFFSTYFLYFKAANKQFANASITPEELPKALAQWGNWHWGRVTFEMAAFICSLLIIAYC